MSQKGGGRSDSRGKRRGVLPKEESQGSPELTKGELNGRGLRGYEECPGGPDS